MRKHALAIFCLTLLTSASATLAAEPAQMKVLDGQDVSGKVFQRFGFPSQNYCDQRCLQEDRCVATRWGVIEGTTAGQCQLITGDLKYSEPREIKTEDGQKIVVVVSIKSDGSSRPQG